jgi:hypothetical protein
VDHFRLVEAFLGGIASGAAPTGTFAKAPGEEGAAARQNSDGFSVADIVLTASAINDVRPNQCGAHA